MISGPQRKFCEGIVKGLNGTKAYQEAYPNAAYGSAKANASELLTKTNILSEIARIRREASLLPGSAHMTQAEKRNVLAGIVRAPKAKFRGSHVKTSDRVAAIDRDNDLAGEGSESHANDAFSELLLEIRK